MSKRRGTKVIDGVLYYDDRPKDCSVCHFWKNKKSGCILGIGECYYLAEPIQTPQETKCSRCCYKINGLCVSASCYQDLEKWLHMVRAAKASAERK